MCNPSFMGLSKPTYEGEFLSIPANQRFYELNIFE